MIKNIYLAGSWPDRDEVAKIGELLEAKGYNITHKWYLHENIHHSKVDELAKQAAADLNGVFNADVVIACPGWFGTCFEAGIAIGMGLPMAFLRTPEMWKWTVFQDNAWREPIFYHMTVMPKITSMHELFSWLEQLR